MVRAGATWAEHATALEGARDGPPDELHSLTALRAVAAVEIFFVHTGFFFTGGPLARVQMVFASHGTFGVSLFFILSGIVLTLNYPAPVSRGAYQLRRFARIWPVHVLCTLLAATIAIAATWQMPRFGIGVWLLNLTFLDVWGNTHVINSPSWTLGCEAFFYFMFPWLVVGAGAALRFARGPVIAATVVLAMSLEPFRLSVVNAQFALSPLSRLPEFVLGCCIGLLLPSLARVVRRPRVAFLAAAALSLLAATAAMAVSIPLSCVTITVVPFALLLAAAAVCDLRGVRSGIEGSRWVAAGRWSYAFYLVHVPVISVVEGVVGTPPASVLAELACLGVALLLTVVSAAMIYRFLEEPARRAITRPRRPVPAPAAA